MNVLAGEARVEIERIKGSRFLGIALPIEGEGEAMARLTAVRAEFPDATHHCWGWRLDDDRFRYSDDGEPSGTAGRPIDAAIRGRDLQDALCIVVRWFGGTKLGSGGLVKAYGAGAAAALDAAEVIPYVLRKTMILRVAFGDLGAVRSVLTAWSLEEDDAAYAHEVQLTVTVVADAAEALVADLVERTAGRIAIR